MKSIDITVIGAGVIGQSIAFRLKQRRPELRVAVLGDAVNSLMASRAAAGMLAPFAECERADRFFHFCRESLEKYPRFVEEVVSVSGTAVYLSCAGSIMPRLLVGEKWEDRLRFFKAQDIPHEVWTVGEVRKKVPALSETCGEVIWVEQGQVNNRQLHDALITASKRIGVQMLNQNVTGLIVSGNSLTHAVTDSGEVASERFVFANGSWSTQLARVLDVFLPLKPVKGQMCRVRVEKNTLPYTVSGYTTYIAPWQGDQGFVLGSTMEDRGFDPGIEKEAIQGLIDRAAVIMPCLRDAPLIETWTGLRPAAEDRMPIMGQSARYENLFYSTGHFRNGILQTPNQSDYMVDLILGKREENIPEFSPTRYSL